MIENKFKTLNELTEIVEGLKKQGKKIILCHGCYDYAHYGHSLHFLDAKKVGGENSILIVTVTPDKFISKGPGRPYFSEGVRLGQLSCLQPVDYVALNEWDTAIETINTLKPNIYVKGKEVLDNKEIDEKKVDNSELKKSNLELEIEALEKIGGKIHFTEEMTFSSSSLINQITSAIPEESKIYLENLRKTYPIKDGKNQVLEMIKSLEEIRPLIIGDSIFDEYIYVEPLEKSAKSTIIPHQQVNSEIHLGGVFAVANHISGFTRNPRIITCIGDNYKDILDKGLKDNITRLIYPENDQETVSKTRYIDNYTREKRFELYNTKKLMISEENEKRVLDYLRKNHDDFDMIVVSDFGHGMMTKKIVDYITGCGKFLAVNCQLNGGNLGYNFITKYRTADFASLNERELRLPFQEELSDISVPLKKLSTNHGLHLINITQGKFGSVYYDNGNRFHSPAFTMDPIDSMGAGDAVYSLTSLLVYKNKEIPSELVPFLGNCMGAIASRIVGNRKSIDQIDLKKFVSYIMK